MTESEQLEIRLVVCAANRRRLDGLVVCGARHFDSIMHAAMKAIGEYPESWRDSEQGFIDQFGIFLTREEALVVALNKNQIRRNCGGDSSKLYSENLY